MGGGSSSLVLVVGHGAAGETNASRHVLGSLYQHYPGYESRLREALLLLLGEEVEKLVLMGLAKDGSEVGGAHSLKPHS